MRKERDILKVSQLETNNGQLGWLPKNPRQWTQTDIDRTKASIQEDTDFLEDRPLLVCPGLSGKYVVFGGNLRLTAARSLKLKEVPVVVYCLDEGGPEQDEIRETVKRRAMKDNGSFGAWDYEALANEWDDLPLTDWGVPAWEGEAEPAATEVKEDDFNEDAEVETRCNPGDIWQLGEHRLMCGDSTDGEQVALLMDGAKADLVFTDPPYGMNAVSKSGVLSKRYDSDIMGDDDNETAKNAFIIITQMYPDSRHIWFGANYYTEVLPSSECWIVWDKNNGASDQTDCELAWTNIRSVVRQFTMASEKKGRVHPTQKPVRLVSEIVNRFEGDKQYHNILDVFGGSGTTLIAAEQLNRRCFMMELDPHYCDVIISRWETFTGKTAQLITPGDKVS